MAKILRLQNSYLKLIQLQPLKENSDIVVYRFKSGSTGVTCVYKDCYHLTIKSAAKAAITEGEECLCIDSNGKEVNLGIVQSIQYIEEVGYIIIFNALSS